MSLIDDPEHIGFTGTQVGMTLAQQASVLSFLSTRGSRSFVLHHGDCVGADAQADAIARQCFMLDHVEIHPCDIVGKRARCQLGHLDLVHPVKKPLIRNMDIVLACDLIVATPKEDHPVLRSGTWTTVRYALMEEKRVVVIVPNGAIIPWQ